MELAQYAFQYSVAGVRSDARWANWYHTDEAQYATASICSVPGMQIPATNKLLYNPFRMDQVGSVRPGPSAALLERSFVTQNEAQLRGQGFSAKAAKYIAYVRLCLTANGCLASYGLRAAPMPLIHRIQAPLPLDHTPIDDDIFRMVAESWSTLVYTALGAYMDVGHAISEVTAQRAEALWVVTKWASCMEECDVQWPHVYKYALQVFPPEALLLAATVRMLTGGMPSAPIYDSVSYRVDAKCAMAMISPWGPATIPQWWKACVAQTVQLISTHRTNLRAAAATMPTDAFHPNIQAWISSDIDPYLDVIRILLPVLVPTLRPMYMPALHSRLYLSSQQADVDIAAHAHSFARMLVTQAFGQHQLTSLGFSPRDIHGVTDFRKFMYGHGASTALVPASERLLSWGIVPGALANTHVPAFDPVVQLEQGLMDLGLADDASSVADTVADAAEAMDMISAEEQALHLAKRRFAIKLYQDEELLSILRRPRSDSIFKPFWRPELCAAKKTYDRAMLAAAKRQKGPQSYLASAGMATVEEE